MAAVDPTFPLYPLISLISSALLLVILFTSFVRQSWNLGVAFLCFWLSLENLTTAVNTILWADNADVKLHVYCDIVTRLQFVASIVRPMSTLIIVRRLSLIASLQTVEITQGSTRRWDQLLEWTLGLGVPLLVAGPLYYIVQESRFQVFEGIGCRNDEVPSVLTIVLIDLWNIITPLLSITIYCPKVVRTFYRHGKDVSRFLRSNNSVSTTIYFRILILASIDFLLTLPVNLTTLALEVSYSLQYERLPFYPGWGAVHSDWTPRGYDYVTIKASGTADVALLYFDIWIAPVLGIVIFGLFGLTAEARGSYWRLACTVGSWFGWKPTAQRQSSQKALGTMQFGDRPLGLTLDAELGTHPSFINSSCVDEVSGIEEREDAAIEKNH